ncbi:MAG: carboxypeptidase-like regulatory domain-containing protein, partial [Pyrinomonadaceae bacterium]
MHRELSPARVSRFASKASALLFTLALFFAASSDIFAQSDNTQLSGYVKDSAGAAITGAKVIVTSEGRNLERAATTNEEGYYVVSSVPPGLYTVAVEQTGFKRFETTNKKVDPGIPASVDATLEPGQVSETVSIIASTAAVQTETSTVSKLVEAKQIQYM